MTPRLSPGREELQVVHRLVGAGGFLLVRVAARRVVEDLEPPLPERVRHKVGGELARRGRDPPLVEGAHAVDGPALVGERQVEGHGRGAGHQGEEKHPIRHPLEEPPVEGGLEGVVRERRDTVAGELPDVVERGEAREHLVRESRGLEGDQADVSEVPELAQLPLEVLLPRVEETGPV